MIPQLKELTVELTLKCYQNCLYCSSNSSLVENIQLSFETVKRVLDDFSILGGEIVELSGGEPLSYEKVYETVDYASERGLKTHLFTCTYLPNEQIDMDGLNKVDRFYVNLQAPNRVIHDYLTQTPGSFDRAIKFIKECKRRGKWVGTHLVPLGPNIDEFDEYMEMAKLLSLDNVSLLRFVAQGRGKNNIFSLNSDEILHLFSAIEKYRGTKSFVFKIGCPLDFGFLYKRSRTAIACKSGISRCVVRPNGNLIPCPAFKDSTDLVAGNVNSDSLIDLWKTSHIFKKLRSFYYKKLRGACKNCSFLTICQGRCHAQRRQFYGDLYQGPDPYCPLVLTRGQKNR